MVKRPRVMTSGYIRVFEPRHPLANADGYVLQHRKVAWDNGIITDPEQHVHHRNRDRSDNRPENLKAMSAPEHHRFHATEAGEVINQFGAWPLLGRLTCPVCGVTFRPRDHRVSTCSRSCGQKLRYSEVARSADDGGPLAGASSSTERGAAGPRSLLMSLPSAASRPKPAVPFRLSG